MKRFALSAVVACLCGCAMTGTGRADIIYDIYSGGVSGTLEAEYDLQSFIDTNTDISPFTPTVLNAQVDSPGTLIAGHGFIAGHFEYQGNDGTSRVMVTLNSSQLPTSTGTYSLFGIVLNTGSTDVANLDTLVITESTTATPEPASLTLAAIGAVGLAGYGWRRRRRAAV
jgi:MYXO-CTERM domain-containing protein